MDLKRAENEILTLDQLIEVEPTDYELYLRRGKLLYALGQMDTALNDFIEVRELKPENEEAAEYVRMISEIFEFQYKDIYNP